MDYYLFPCTVAPTDRPRPPTKSWNRMDTEGGDRPCIEKAAVTGRTMVDVHLLCIFKEREMFHARLAPLFSTPSAQ